MAAKQESSAFSILVTDDDRSFRQSLTSLFEARGFATFEAACGEEAIEIVQGENVHLVLLDMHMPTITGLETLRIVKQIKAFLPCIIVTANADRWLIQEALSARAFSVLSKPVSNPLVMNTVNRALRRAYQG